jgi:thioredoxin 1
MPIINVETTEDYLYYLNNNAYVIANFTASFCKPCKEIYPFIETLTTEFPNIVFLKIDIENGYKISDQYNITSIPYFKFYKYSNEINSYCGTDKKMIYKAISTLIDDTNGNDTY